MMNVRSIWSGLYEERKQKAAAEGGCEKGSHVWLVSNSRLCDEGHVHVEGFCSECRVERERMVHRMLFAGTPYSELYALLEEQPS